MPTTAKQRHQKAIKRTRAKRDAAYRRADAETAKRHEASLMNWGLTPKLAEVKIIVKL